MRPTDADSITSPCAVDHRCRPAPPPALKLRPRVGLVGETSSRSSPKPSARPRSRSRRWTARSTDAAPGVEAGAFREVRHHVRAGRHADLPGGQRRRRPERRDGQHARASSPRGRSSATENGKDFGGLGFQAETRGEPHATSSPICGTTSARSGRPTIRRPTTTRRINQLWWGQRFADGRFGFIVGKIDPGVAHQHQPVRRLGQHAVLRPAVRDQPRPLVPGQRAWGSCCAPSRPTGSTSTSRCPTATRSARTRRSRRSRAGGSTPARSGSSR